MDSGDKDYEEIKYAAVQMIHLIRTKMQELGDDYSALCFVNEYVNDMCHYVLKQKANLDSLSLIFIHASGAIWCDYSDILNKETHKMLSDIISMKIKMMK